MRWAVLALASALSLFFLNAAAYCAWASGGPPTEHAAWWLQRAASQLGLAISAGAAGWIVFVALGESGRQTKIRTLIVGLAVIALSALAPAIREFWHQDRCLDAGGTWQKSTFRCIHESEDLESGGSFP